MKVAFNEPNAVEKAPQQVQPLFGHVLVCSTGSRFLPNAPPPVYRAGGGVKKMSTPTGSGWEFTVSKMVFDKTGR